ncbi:F-box/kelch-repeat protein At1g15670-like [Impatiens glandulifera]|uniref:F-box/kelch-repeat protein At1g15670-like n=1 Tax=Impatiens glandulifera TaxID=253017 RepID=UPI001FB0C6D4|nr:F-box/kelch-repeat protein At1g15670-like [Impatiens glandulifera]
MKHSRLSEDLILECLVRLPRKSRYTASLVCRKWLQLIESRQFYLLRKQLGLIKHSACLLHANPEMRSDEPPTPSYVINVLNPLSGECKTLSPLPNSTVEFDDLSQIVSSQGKLVLLNSSDPFVSSLSNSLFVFDFSSGRWRQGKNLPKRKFSFAMAASDDCRVFVAGGYIITGRR